MGIPNMGNMCGSGEEEDPKGPEKFVTHVFLWKWSEHFATAEQQAQVLADLKKLKDQYVLGEVRVGPNIIEELGWGGENAKTEHSKDFDCGLTLTTKEADFKKWWDGEAHSGFGAKYNNE